MKCVGARAPPRHLGDDPRATAFRARQRFEHERSGALAADEPVPSLVERAAGALGRVVPSAQREHRRKSRNARGGDRGFGAPRDHHVCLTAPDPLDGFADRMRARGAGARVAVRRATKTVFDAHLTRGEVSDERRNEIGAHPARPLLIYEKRDFLEVLEPADADADEAARPVALLFGERELGMLDGHLRGAHREGDEARRFLHLLLRHEELGLIPLHLTRKARWETLVAGEQSDVPSGALAVDQRAPGFFGPYAARRDETDSSNDDALHALLAASSGHRRLARRGGHWRV